MKDKFYYSDGTTSEIIEPGKPLHRIVGPAIESFNGEREWFQNDLRHRIDGPALELVNGTKYWYQNDQLHRTDGPAIEYFDGEVQWYVRGIEIKVRPMTAERLQKVLVLL